MKILVIRPSPTGEELANDLNNIGIPSWHFSLFDFYPSSSSISLSKKINILYQSKIILIFSKKSVYYTNLYLKKNNLKWPFHARYYAIGKSTAFFLYNYIKKNFFSYKKRK
ncbi:uroporphyrinogen-III synthase [Buchnera aphidicola (Sitobion miscanthi)]|uniref:uroporphyrinogen-III synthase n=1 Tax=Buchnera aphidicola TaxID=9 RepID=UPI0020B80CC4|nr:uroporphyrinogen-III synthase [Buchnera aphidicola]MCU4137215.1 uroporphyrinogen-III synthase [Buchnera aphidicola (Sitobion miscanthi)]